MTAPTDPSPTPDTPLPAPWPRRHVIALFGFLALFLALLIVFREVLFPFLMAIFLAYLVEPVVGWVARGKRLGLRWGRGPTLVLMYAIVLVGAFLLVSCGVQKAGVTIQRTITQLKGEFDKTDGAAEFLLKQPAPSKVSIPAGTELLLRSPGRPERRYRTAFAASIDEGLSSARVLLDPVAGASTPADAENNLPMTLVAPENLVLPKDKETGKDVDLSVSVDDTAKGIEVVLARRVISPVLQQIEKVTGTSPDPALIRGFITEQSRVHGADFGNQIVAFGQRTIFRIIGSTYELILVLMLTAFLVIDRRKISEFFASLPSPQMRPRYVTLMRYVDRGLAGVIRGQLLICLVNGSLTWIGLTVFGIPYATALAAVAAVFSLIPVFGTIASSIPIVLVAFTTGGLPAGLFALAWISFIHLLEANLFNPLIMGTNAEMHPVLIIFALLAGEHSFGVWGALLAVPTASIIQSSFKYYRHEILGIPHEESHGHGKFVTALLARLRGRSSDPAKGTPA